MREWVSGYKWQAHYILISWNKLNKNKLNSYSEKYVNAIGLVQMLKDECENGQPDPISHLLAKADAKKNYMYMYIWISN